MVATTQDGVHTPLVPLWVERLEKKIEKINGETITAPQGRRLLVDVAFGVVDSARRLGVIEQQQVQILKNNKKEDSDLMRSGLRWFSDKVLPTLLSTGIIALLIWAASVNGLLSTG